MSPRLVYPLWVHFFQRADAPFILLFGVGVGLIYFIYGPGAAGIGLLCLLGSLVPIVLILLSLYGIDWIVKNVRPK